MWILDAKGLITKHRPDKGSNLCCALHNYQQPVDVTCVLQGLEYEEAAKRLWILDAKGLITRQRPAEELSDVQRPFAAVGDDDIEGENLLDVVKRVSCYMCYECTVCGTVV